MSRKVTWFSLLGLAVVVAFVAGCGQSTADPPQAAEPATPLAPREQQAKGEAAHPHKPGLHGGLIVEIGRDNYHAEAVFEKGGVLKLFTLGKDEARVQEVEVQTPTAYVKPEGGTEATAVTLKPQPQDGDAAGRTSLFVGTLPAELAGRAVEVTIPSLRIGGERFRLGFRSAATGAGHEEAEMPAKVADDEERQLYLTTGGKYTAADVEANGRVTASQKFRGFRANHDLKPAPGEKICPVTLTKANPKCSWVVGGQTYEFCCPPCVDEFVKTAKEQPGQVKDPGEYVKK